MKLLATVFGLGQPWLYCGHLVSEPADERCISFPISVSIKICYNTVLHSFPRGSINTICRSKLFWLLELIFSTYVPREDEAGYEIDLWMDTDFQLLVLISFNKYLPNIHSSHIETGP